MTKLNMTPVFNSNPGRWFVMQEEDSTNIKWNMLNKQIEFKVQIHETLHLHCLEKWQSQEKILIRYTIHNYSLLL